jgi:hypothetical protein
MPPTVDEAGVARRREPPLRSHGRGGHCRGRTQEGIIGDAPRRFYGLDLRKQSARIERQFKIRKPNPNPKMMGPTSLSFPDLPVSSTCQTVGNGLGGTLACRR